MSGRDPNYNIQELREEVRRNKIKIVELEQEVQQLKSVYDCSTEKIKKLEDEKKALENKVSEHEKKIKWLEDDVRYFSTGPVITDLKRELKEKDARMDSMEKSFEDERKKKDARINSMEKYFEDRLNDIEKDLRYFVKKSQDKENDLKDCREDLKNQMAKTDELEKSRNMLCIGQLCAKVMEAIYRLILPVYFKDDDYKQPHLRVIDRKIEELYHTRRDKQEAQRKWRSLQADKIDAELVDFMEEMLAERNDVGHPSPLYEKELKNIASNLPGQKQRLFEKVIQIAKDYSALV